MYVDTRSRGMSSWRDKHDINARISIQKCMENVLETILFAGDEWVVHFSLKLNDFLSNTMCTTLCQSSILNPWTKDENYGNEEMYNDALSEIRRKLNALKPQNEDNNTNNVKGRRSKYARKKLDDELSITYNWILTHGQRANAPQSMIIRCFIGALTSRRYFLDCERLCATFLSLQGRVRQVRVCFVTVGTLWVRSVRVCWTRKWIIWHF